jgi:hypothetical protein
MTDIPGLFAVALCFYGCLRALQASTSPATIAWLCFAIRSDAICGTSRQIEGLASSSWSPPLSGCCERRIVFSS